MVNWIQIACSCILLEIGVAGTHLDPECPRHRGLPDGFSRATNRYRNRALYRLDLRSAIKGFIPDREYKFRVQTTVRKLKFNDATVVIDAIDENCGAGSWVATDDLYSPKGCPSIVTTQQKEPMGRAHFKWIAPSCGCVHIRVRVHANSTYFIEDETERNGPLARTICPKAGTVTQPVARGATTTEMPQVLTRNQRLQLLCDVTEANRAEDVMKNEEFVSRRIMSKLTGFELERLHIALEQRHLEVSICCKLDSEFERTECFGDVRRVRIDIFCGNGEPDIPITETRYDWIKQKQPECCPQIGEDRYLCFNYTLHENDMLKDGHGHHSSIDMDDFDPVNYVEDYPQAEEIRMKFSDKLKQKSKVPHTADNAKTKTDVQYKSVKEIGRVKSYKSDFDDNIDTNDKRDMDDTDEPGETDIDTDGTHDRTEDNKKDDAKSRSLSIQECCMNGIDAGTRVVLQGFDGCFKMADRFRSFFNKWTTQCDRHFVICCMRVIDGDFQEVPKSINLRKVLLPRKHICHQGNLLKDLDTFPEASNINSTLNSFKHKKDKLKLKLLKIDKENEVVKLKDEVSHFNSNIDNSNFFDFRYKLPHSSNRRRLKKKKHGLSSKTLLLKRKKFMLHNQNRVLKKTSW